MDDSHKTVIKETKDNTLVTLKSFQKNKVKLTYVVWSQVNGYSGGIETEREHEKGCEGLVMLQVLT